MLAVVALIIFVLAVFGVRPAGLDMIALGLAFVAGHLAFGTLVTLPRLGRRKS